MTNRQRFHMTLSGNAAVDRCPALEWATWWDKTLDGWRTEGFVPAGDDTAIMRQFSLDPLRQFWFDHFTPDCPKPASHGAGLIQTEKDYMALRKYLLPEDAVERMLPSILKTQPEYERGETIVWFTVNGFFWFPRELFGIENHLYSFFDEPKLYHHICEDLLAWQMRTVEKFSHYIKADFCTVAEDMSYNHGSMISEEMWDEFIQPYYRQLVPTIKQHGTKVFIDSDGDITKSVPWFLRAGIDGILPLERQSSVDVNALRAQFPQLLMIGGFDKMCMFEGEGAIRAEFERILPALRKGGYLPAMDHQTPPGTKLGDYEVFVRLLKEYGAQACKDCRE